MPQVTASTETRLQALDGKRSECEHHHCADLISELAILNSNVKALTEAMVSIMKHCELNPLQSSKLDGVEATAADVNIGETVPSLLPPAVTEPEGPERTRFYTRLHTGSRKKETARATTPPPVVLSAEGPVSKDVGSPSDRVEATPTDEGQGASTSPGSDCVPISPPPKALKPATTARRRPTSNARGKAAAKERAAEDDDEFLPATDMAPAAPASKKVGN